MTDSLKWGILSTARINRRIIPPLKQSKRSEVLAVASRNLTSAAEFAQKWDIPLTFGQYEAMLASPDIDAIYISLPNSMHHEWTIKAVQAGKHVLCEKPLATSVAEVDEIIQTAQAQGVVVQEALHYQMHPQLATLKTIIQEGLIGPVILIQAKFSFFLPEDADNFRLVQAPGSGSLWDVGCYPVSFANAIAGGPPISVFAYQQTDLNDVEVVLAGQLKFAGDIIAQINCGFRMPYRIGAEVIGREGVIRIPQPWQPDTDQRTSGLIHIAPDDTETLIPTEVINPYLCQIQVVEGAILDGEPSPFPLSRSRETITTIQKLSESAEKGRVIALT